MSFAPARTDTSLIGRWWWTVDRWMLFALMFLFACGAILTLAASPSVAVRINLDSFHFVRQQLLLLPIALAVIVFVSLFTPRLVRRVALILLLGALLFSVAAALTGAEIKGARRWIILGGFSLQPSEFLKPGFAVVAAWLCATANMKEKFPGRTITTLICVMTIAVLVLQPDVGMSGVVFSIWFAQMFMAGLPLFLIVAGLLMVAGAVVVAYNMLPHVQQRIDLFLDPSSGSTYQIDQSIGAFMNGGILGLGPGEGIVKNRLPDAHSDFIFAVAAEEFGLLACLLIVGAYAFVVLRGFGRVVEDSNLFILYATTNLLVAFGLQALINMASALHMMPTKGMTLPFISYGGSSLLALSLGMGMVLALTRRRAGMMA